MENEYFTDTVQGLPGTVKNKITQSRLCRLLGIALIIQILFLQTTAEDSLKSIATYINQTDNLFDKFSSK